MTQATYKILAWGSLAGTRPHRLKGDQLSNALFQRVTAGPASWLLIGHGGQMTDGPVPALRLQRRTGGQGTLAGGLPDVTLAPDADGFLVKAWREKAYPCPGRQHP